MPKQPKKLIMTKSYKIVSEKEIEFKNGYFELKIENEGEEESIFFSTNAANLQSIAKTIINSKGLSVDKFSVLPHLKL